MVALTISDYTYSNWSVLINAIHQLCTCIVRRPTVSRIAMNRNLGYHPPLSLCSQFLCMSEEWRNDGRHWRHNFVILVLYYYSVSKVYRSKVWLCIGFVEFFKEFRRNVQKYFSEWLHFYSVQRWQSAIEDLGQKGTVDCHIDVVNSRITVCPHRFRYSSWKSIYRKLSSVFNLIFTARCTLVQSAVLRSHVVCLSVRLFAKDSSCQVAG